MCQASTKLLNKKIKKKLATKKASNNGLRHFWRSCTMDGFDGCRKKEHIEYIEDT